MLMLDFRPRLFVALSALAVVSATGFSPMSAQTPSGLSEQDAYRDFGYIPMKDGVRLAYSLWRPKKEGKYPTLFQYSAYAEDALQFSVAKAFVDAGYAFLGVNVRGSGCSEGADFLPFASNEGPDGAQVVEWAAAQPWSSGNVGMVGNSYSGSVQYAVAAEHPPHLKALSAGGSNTSRYRDWLMVGGMFHQGNIGNWGLVSQMNNARTGAERRIKEWGDKACEAIVAKQKPHDWYWKVRQHPLQDEFWESVGLSHEHVAPLITIPTQVMAGFQDEATAPNAASRLFAHLLVKAPVKKLVYTNGGHGAVGLAPLVKERIRWMDHWLKGENNGVEREPPVTVFWEMERPGGNNNKAAPSWTTTYANWPPPNLQRATYYLTADARLTPQRHGTASDGDGGTSADSGVRTYLYPAGTELIGSNAQFAVAPYSIGSLQYRTEPMAADTTILGNAELTFHFSSEQRDADFMVTLKDVDADGNTLYLTRGFLRASMRAIDPARTWPDEVTQSFRKVEELVPGQIYEAKLSLWTLGHIVRQGHLLELSILAPNPIPGPGLGGSPVGAPSVNSIHHSAQYPSRLVLPIVPGEKAQAPAPECGTLWNQPCRKGVPPAAPGPGGTDGRGSADGRSGNANAWQGGIVRR